MLEVNDFIADRGGDPKKIRESQRRRYAPESIVDEVQAMFEDHRRSARNNVTPQTSDRLTSPNLSELRFPNDRQQDQRQAERDRSKEEGRWACFAPLAQTGRTDAARIAQNKENADDLMKQKDELQKQKKAQDDVAAEKLAALHKKVKTVGNYVHEDVPVSDNEDNNKLIRDWSPSGDKPAKKDCLSHHEVLTRLDGYDPTRGVKVVGHRGYCLTGHGVFLNLALINYGLEFLYSKGYTPNQPPFFMARGAMAKTAQLEQFDEELYKVTEDDKAENDKYLIATSEQPLSALHDGEWLQDKDLPIKYAGYSTCFRKEAGSHGKDAWGIFRVHQFEKIEQFILCNPSHSQDHFATMLALSEEFYRSLKLPHRVVAIVSGALNNAAAAKHDLEAWFPFQGEYKELVSCSNCTDYQTRELEVRYGPKTQADKDGRRKVYVHALNATLCATERALCCVLENYQREDGVEVPEVLRKYIPGQPDFLPYTKELPKDSTSKKMAVR